MKKDINIVGAGLVGSLCALYMIKRGYNVTIYERRQDLRSEIVEAGKSINFLTLSQSRNAESFKYFGWEFKSYVDARIVFNTLL